MPKSRVRSTLVLTPGHSAKEQRQPRGRVFDGGARLGHSSITITLDRYAHLLPSVEEALADALDAAFAAEAAPSNVAELRRAEEA